jgi:hypothetical protein
LSRFYCKLFIIVALIVSLNAGDASAKSPGLSGKMAWWQHIVGFWLCHVTIEPGNGQYPQKGYTFGEGSALPGNVFRWSEIASGFAADQYNGYSDARKAWWESQANSGGSAMISRSLDGLTYDQISLPSSLEDSGGGYREVYSLRGDGSFYEVDKRRIGGSWHVDSLSLCKRMPSNRQMQRPASRCSGPNCGF